MEYTYPLVLKVRYFEKLGFFRNLKLPPSEKSSSSELSVMGVKEAMTVGWGGGGFSSSQATTCSIRGSTTPNAAAGLREISCGPTDVREIITSDYVHRAAFWFSISRWTKKRWELLTSDGVLDVMLGESHIQYLSDQRGYRLWSLDCCRWSWLHFLCLTYRLLIK